MIVKKKTVIFITLSMITTTFIINPVSAKELKGKDIYMNNNVVVDSQETYIKDGKVMFPFHKLENIMNFKYNQKLDLMDRKGRIYDWMYLKGNDLGIEMISFYPRNKTYRINYLNGNIGEGNFYFQEVVNNTLYVSSDIFRVIFKKPIISNEKDDIVLVGNDNITNIQFRELEDRSKYPYITASEVEEYIKLKGRDFKTGLEDFDDIESIVKSINQLLKKCIKDNMTDVEKLKSIHDEMIRLTGYENKLSSLEYPYQDTATGVSKYKRASCSGYSEYYMLACNAVGLDVGIIHGYVNGGYHAWNFIYKDGVRYNIDVLWDDAIGNIPSYKYFYKKDDEMSSSSAKYSFGKEQKSELRKVINI